MDPFTEVLAEIDAQQRLFEQAEQAMLRTEVTGRSRNGEVTAKVAGAGRVTEVTIDPRTLQRLGAQAIGALVAEAVNDGLARMTVAGRKHFEQLFGPTEPEVRQRIAAEPEVRQ
jgi:nucleoid-associated protein EbfC